MTDVIPKTKKTVDELVNKRISELLGFVDENFIVTFNEKTGIVFVGGERITPEQAQNLKQEAELIKTLQIWKIFQNSIGDMARKTMFEKSMTFEDLRSGKMMLYNLSILKKIVDIFAKFVKK